MKKILICSHWMEIGGAERALLGLLYNLDYTKYQVDLYLCRHSGEFMKILPKEVNLLPEDKNAAAIAIPAKQTLKEGCLGIVLGRVMGKIQTASYMKKHKDLHLSNVAIEYSNKYTYKFVKPINPGVTYDLLISFLEPHYIAAYKAKARKKIAWMHTDYNAISVDVDEGYRIWNKFDGIAAISQDCFNNFARVFPKLSDKLFLMENMASPLMVEKQAQEQIEDTEMQADGCIKLLSIGRFCTAKNFDNVPDICKRICNANINVKWYLIGYGGEEELIRTKISEAKMEDRVIILGKKENPYPYIKACDLYVQPSRYEGKCVTVREAQMLGKPVLITKYPTSSSQLEDGVDGVVVPMDNEGCARGIIELLNNPKKMEELSENCKKRDYSNAREVEKIYRMLEE